MCRKMIYLASFVLMLALAAGTAVADLVAHYPLNEGIGNTTADASGNGHDGTIQGTPTWINSMSGFGKALYFDGQNPATGWVNCGTWDPSEGTGQFTIAIWVRWDGPVAGVWQGIMGKRDDWAEGQVVWYLEVNMENQQVALGRYGVYPNCGGRVLPLREWAHVAATFDGTILVFYIDGEETGRGNFSLGSKTNATIEIGCDNLSGWNSFHGALDEVRIYNNALTAQEIQIAMLPGAGPKNATAPSPANEAVDVPRDVVLSWSPGAFAAPVNGHKVYFSESFKDVKDGIGGIALSATSYAPGQRLDFNTTYYWRVDEVNGPPDYTVYQGSVWSFTTEPFAYAIENITAKASSQVANRGPENTVNGSGLDNSGLLHGKDADDNMWLSDPAGPQPTWIEFEFDNVYKLHELWIWNSNDSLESVLGFGFKDVTIEYSANGIDYTTLGNTHQFARAPGAPDYAHNTTVDLGGIAAKYVRLRANNNWGGILPQFGLSEVRFFYIPVYAREPSPASGASNVDVDAVLSFRAGREAAKHNVYFSADQQAVIDGTAPVATVTKASYGPLSLDLGKTYYWRVDEVNEAQTPARWQGDIWDFTAQEYFIVDDFESYNDLDTTDPQSNRIFNTWIDGYGTTTNGSIVGYDVPPFAEKIIFHGGEQSMPFAYSNTAGKAYSEAERTFAVGQDWTKAGSQTLVLYFQGVAGNTGQLYVKINSSKVVYNGDAGDIVKPQWKQWNIALASLGVNLQNVTKLSIGIDGNGASGKLYFDDIRLYRSVP